MLAIVAVAAATIRLWPAVLEDYVGFVFLVAVYVSALVGGYGPGFLAIPLSILLADYVLLDIEGTLPEPELLIGNIAFAIVSAVLVWLVARRRTVERALKISERRFRVAQELSLDAFVLLRAVRDASGAIVDFEWVYANPAAERMAGRAGLVGRRLRAEFPGVDPHRIFERYAAVVETGQPYQGEYPYVAEGVSGWFRSTAVKLEDGVAVSLSDITERKQAEQALEKSEARFRVALRNSPIMVIEQDRDLRYRWVYNAMPGVDPRQLLGKSDRDLLAPEDAERIEAVKRGAIDSGQPLRAMVEFAVLGEQRTYDLTLEPHRNGAGEVDGVLGAAMDVTGLKRIEQELRALNETLEQRVEERTFELERSYEKLRQSERLAAIGEMITGLSHESRNALQRSLACLELLAKKHIEGPRARELLAEALRAQQDLQRVYEDVQEYAGEVRLERSTGPVAAVWREAWEDLEPLWEGRNASLVEDPGTLSLDCSVDKFRMKRVFRNLFENALAAVPDPLHISIGCDECRIYGSAGIRIRLRDNGPGLNEEQARRIFEPFYTTKTKGTGLGMAIAKRLVEAHGGRMAIDPRPGEGLEVRIELPCESE
jgi:PAS domain S-box-containing protein